VGAFIESSVMVGLISTEKTLKVDLSLFLESVATRGPSTTRELKLMDSISLSSNDSLSMKESGVFISKFDPFFS